MAHGMHFGWQHVTQETPDELDPVESEEFFASAAGPVFPSEGDMGVVDFDDSTVSDGGSSDVSAEVFDGGGPGANGLDVDGSHASRVLGGAVQVAGDEESHSTYKDGGRLD